jgi:exopolysaccharide biosynthesis polyprenyl glycosylphosphotransferase
MSEMPVMANDPCVETSSLASLVTGQQNERSLKNILASLMHVGCRMHGVWWLLLDTVLSLVSLLTAYKYSPRQGWWPTDDMQVAYPILVALAGGVLGLYERRLFYRAVSRFLIEIVVVVGTANLFLMMYSYWLHYDIIGRYVIGLNFLIQCALMTAIRSIPLMAARYYKLRVLFIGDPDLFLALTNHHKQQETHFALAGYCCEGQETSSGRKNYLGTIQDIAKVCREKGIHQIVVSSQYARTPNLLHECFKCARLGCRLSDENSFCEEAYERVLVQHIEPDWFYSAKLAKHNDFRSLLKRIMDISVASLGLLFTLPLIAVLWVAVRLTSKGPVFYSQVRCGQFGKPFRIYKFRTMSVDAEKNGAQWAKLKDSRVTPIGSLLRKTRLDEIPQFWNILRGDMSFVGPRPERPEMVAEIEKQVPYFSFRHWARPGLTGLAQIRYRYGGSVDDAEVKLQHDLYYVKNWSLFLDCQIILRTLSAIMRGAR